MGILTRIQECQLPDGLSTTGQEFVFHEDGGNIGESTVAYHIDLLEEAGFILVKDIIGENNVRSQKLQMTWAGHEYYDNYCRTE